MIGYRHEDWVSNVPQMTVHEERAWELYCQETAGSMDVRDFWCELSRRVQAVYLERTA